MSRRRGFADRLFRALLRLLPAEFRGDFGDDMAADFADARADRGRWSRAALLTREVAGLIRTAARQHAADVLQDTRYAWRVMRRTPRTTAVIIATFAVGIGANAAIFSVVDAVLLYSPFRDPSRIVLLTDVHDPARQTVLNARPEEVQRLTAMTDVFDSVSVFEEARSTLTGVAQARRIRIQCASASMFQVLGVQPRTGRSFSEPDDRPGAAPVVVLSEGLWRSAFGGRPVIGDVVRLNDHPVTIIGILPPEVDSVRSLGTMDAWAPIGAGTDVPSETGCKVWGSSNVYARIRADLSIQDADLRLRALTGGTRGLMSLADSTSGDVRPTLLVLSVAVGGVLLIACANVANLLVERAANRRREIATRLALGAGAGRVVRQMLVESVWLALSGTVAGLMAAQLAVALIVDLLPASMPNLRFIAVNERVMAVSLIAGWAAGLLAGLLPALHAVRPQLTGAIHDARAATAPARSWIRQAFLVAEVAVSVALLIAGVLTARSFTTLRPSQPGFETSNRLVVKLFLDAAPRYQNAPDQWLAFFEEAQARFSRLPDVVGVSGTTTTPLSGVVGLVPVRVVGAPPASSTPPRIFTTTVTSNYLEEMGMPIVQGRGFTPEDRRGRTPVVVVNEALVRTLFPGGSALGQQLTIAARDFGTTPFLIVGVVRDARLFSSTTRPSPEVFVSFSQSPTSRLMVMVRTTPGEHSNLPVLLRREVNSVDPTQMIDAITPFENLLATSVAPWRFVTWLMGIFAAMAVALAAVGLAAVIASAVTQRTREIGVRLALGATRPSVVRLMLSQTIGVALAGTAIGLALAFGTMSFLSGSLYGVTARDPLTFAAGAILMLVVVAVASYLPARRATRIDPMVALRCD